MTNFRSSAKCIWLILTFSDHPRSVYFLCAVTAVCVEITRIDIGMCWWCFLRTADCCNVQKQTIVNHKYLIVDSLRFDTVNFLTTSFMLTISATFHSLTDHCIFTDTNRYYLIYLIIRFVHSIRLADNIIHFYTVMQRTQRIIFIPTG